MPPKSNFVHCQRICSDVLLLRTFPIVRCYSLPRAANGPHRTCFQRVLIQDLTRNLMLPIYLHFNTVRSNQVHIHNTPLLLPSRSQLSLQKNAGLVLIGMHHSSIHKCLLHTNHVPDASHQRIYTHQVPIRNSNLELCHQTN